MDQDNNNDNDMYNSGDSTTEYPDNYSSVQSESSADKIVKRIKKSSVNMISFRSAIIAFIFAVAFVAIILAVLVHNGWLANDTVGNAQIKNSETYELDGLDVAGNAVLGTNLGDTLTVNSVIGSSLIPSEGSSFDLGSSDNYWKDLYVQSVSVSGGVCVSGLARLSRIDNVLINDSDIPNYQPKNLGVSDSGKIFFVNHDRDANPEGICFRLPSLEGPAIHSGINYKFITSTGLSREFGGMSFKLQSTEGGPFNHLHGMINLFEHGTSKVYNIFAGQRPRVTHTSVELLLKGPIFEGSRIECNTNGNDWYINGSIGICPLTNVHFIDNPTQNGISATLEDGTTGVSYMFTI